MKKYRLIKEFPGSMGKGYIANEDEFTFMDEYPEFWEEVKDLDFEVVATKGDGTLDIYSIKRLSDGEIFSIGDICYPKTNISNRHKIIRFEFNKSKHLRVVSDRYYVGIENLIKIKELLFITNDGIEVFENDIIHGVINNRYAGNWKASISLFVGFFIYFSTKEAAQQYIDNNKPIYSKAQIDSAISECYISTTIGNFIKENDFKQQLNLN